MFPPGFNALRASKKLMLNQPLFVLKYSKKEGLFCKKSHKKMMLFNGQNGLIFLKIYLQIHLFFELKKGRIFNCHVFKFFFRSIRGLPF